MKRRTLLFIIVGTILMSSASPLCYAMDEKLAQYAKLTIRAGRFCPMYERTRTGVRSHTKIVFALSANGGTHNLLNLSYGARSEETSRLYLCREGFYFATLIFNEKDDFYHKLLQVPGKDIVYETGSAKEMLAQTQVDKKARNWEMSLLEQELPLSTSGVVYRASTAWELALVVPKDSAAGLDSILSQWSDQCSTKTLCKEMALYLTSTILSTQKAISDAELMEWVEALDHDQFAIRTQAERKIQNSGLLFYIIQKISWDALHPEQQMRLTRLINEFDFEQANDRSIEVFVKRILQNPRNCLAFLERLDEAQNREIVWKQFLQLRKDRPEYFTPSAPESLDFDPAAEPSVRNEQIQTLYSYVKMD
ncbi:MAG: hypothetical protein Q4D38_09395 [Planctomycetia bacterium]|nr:hypothetical protein [Planctomycetia bacterium]